MKKIVIALVVVGFVVFGFLQSSKKGSRSSKTAGTAPSQDVSFTGPGPGPGPETSRENCVFLFPLQGPRLDAQSSEIQKVLAPFKEEGKYVTEKVLLADGKTEIFYRQSTCNGFYSDLTMKPFTLAPGQEEWIATAKEILEKEMFTEQGKLFPQQFFPYINDPQFIPTTDTDSVSFRCRPNETWKLPSICTVGSKDGVFKISFALDVPKSLRESIKDTLQK